MNHDSLKQQDHCLGLDGSAPSDVYLIILFSDTGPKEERALRPSRRPRRHNENIIAVQGSDDGDADGGAARRLLAQRRCPQGTAEGATGKWGLIT